MHRTEFIGTFLLVCLVGFATLTPAGVWGSLAVGLGLTGLIYMGGHVSWAQYNPAVSLAFWLRGEQPLARTLALIAVQFTAAIAAAAVVHAGAPESWAFTVVPSDWTTGKKGPAVIAEFVFTFMMVLVILNVAKHPATAGNGFYAVAIGLTVTSGSILAGPISGASLNPSLTLGPLLVQTVKGLPGGAEASKLWNPALTMVVTQITAAVAASVFSRGQLPRKI